MANGKLSELSMDFAVSILNLCDGIKGHSSLVNQLERAATSIGANIREANYAHSRPDFIAKLQIALKECYETEYWLELFKNTATISVTEYNQMMLQCNKIRRLLSASVNTAKENQRQAQKMNGSFGT